MIIILFLVLLVASAVWAWRSLKDLRRPEVAKVKNKKRLLFGVIRLPKAF